MDATKAGLDRAEAEEKYIKKQEEKNKKKKKEKKEKGISSLPYHLNHPLGHQTPPFSPSPVACSHR